MRITKEERHIFVENIATCGPNAKVWLFGSRVDDSKRGGRYRPRHLIPDDRERRAQKDTPRHYRIGRQFEEFEGSYHPVLFELLRGIRQDNRMGRINRKEKKREKGEIFLLLPYYLSLSFPVHPENPVILSSSNC